MFPFSTAKKLPVCIYEKVNLKNLGGEVIIDYPIQRGMIGIGQKFEKFSNSKKSAEITIQGKLVFKGHVHIGKDVRIYVGGKAYCEFGHMTCLGSDVRIVCTEKIVLGTWARIGYESQIVDTNSHRMKSLNPTKNYPLSQPIFIGDYNSISNRVSIMPGAKTPNYCVIASNSLANKDYSELGNNTLLGGIPIKLIKKDFTRDWEGERKLLEESLIAKW